MRILPYNLLPDEARRTFQKEYRGRVWFLFLFCFALFFAGSALLLAPTIYMAYESEGGLTREVTSNEQEAARISANQLNLEVKRVNEASEIFSFSPVYAYSDLLNEIAKRRNPGVIISRIELSLNKEGTLLVGGLASTREDLLIFRRAFERSVPFRGAEIPVSVFAKNRDLPFTMNIYVATGTSE